METDVDKYISTGVSPLTAQPQANEFAKTKRGAVFPPGSSWAVGDHAAQCRKEQLHLRASLIVLTVISTLRYEALSLARVPWAFEKKSKYGIEKIRLK